MIPRNLAFDIAVNFFIHTCISYNPEIKERKISFWALCLKPMYGNVVLVKVYALFYKKTLKGILYFKLTSSEYKIKTMGFVKVTLQARSRVIQLLTMSS